MPEASSIDLESADYAAKARINNSNVQQYQRIFWGGYKHHVRGLLTGVVLGALAGAAIGLAVFTIAPAIGALAIAAFAGAGALFGAEQLSSIGTAAGAKAASLAENHASKLDPANGREQEKILNDRLMDFNDHHYEVENDKKSKKFQWKSGFTGAAIGIAAGGLIGAASMSSIGALSALAELPLLGTLAHVGVVAAIAGATGFGAPIIAGALILGVLGLTFGIDRGIFKSVFNKMDSFFTGKPPKAREQSVGLETGTELQDHRLEREKVIAKLHKKYDEKIFMGGIKGYLQGAFGGALIGALTGVVAGGLLALVAASAPLVVPIVVGCVLAGTMFGVTTFSGAGYNAGVEATSRTIDNEFQLRELQKEKGFAVEPSKNIDADSKQLSGKIFDGALKVIGEVSDKSKAVYNKVYAGDTDKASIAQQQTTYYDKVTSAEAAELNKRLEKNPKSDMEDPMSVMTRKIPDEQKSFTETITQQQKIKQLPAAIQ